MNYSLGTTILEVDLVSVSCFLLYQWQLTKDLVDCTAMCKPLSNERIVCCV